LLKVDFGKLAEKYLKRKNKTVPSTPNKLEGKN
jgi:hypothetical protein